MTQRHEYVYRLTDLAFDAQHIVDGETLLRNPVQTDAEALAALMLDAYRGTTDDDGETIDDARAEVASFFAAQTDPPLLPCSWLCIRSDRIVAACLVLWWAKRGVPLIAYVMTRADSKRMALGRRAALHSLASAQQAGYAEIRAVITDGNTPSERLFARIGFAPVGERESKT